MVVLVMLENIKRDESGFSLLEIMIGLVLLVIIGLAFYGALTTALRTVLLTQERTTAESLVRSLMEQIKEAPYAEVYTPGINPDIDIPEEYENALTFPNTRKFDITGKPMKGWVMVSSKGHD